MASPGWMYLCQGNANEALDAFADQATSQPLRGGPKVGYALAAAARGDLGRGIWAMRRACLIDPGALDNVRVDDNLRPTVDALVRRYTALGHQSRAERDASFMLASLHYLNGHMGKSQLALDRAIESGDQTESLKQLQGLIVARTETGPAESPPSEKDELPPPNGSAKSEKPTGGENE